MEDIDTIVQGAVLKIHLHGRESVNRFVVIENTGTALEIVDAQSPYLCYVIHYDNNTLRDVTGSTIPILEIEPDLSPETVTKHLAYSAFVEEIVTLLNTNEEVYPVNAERLELIGTVGALFYDDRLPSPLPRAYALLKLMGVETNTRNVAILTAALFSDMSNPGIALVAL